MSLTRYSRVKKTTNIPSATLKNSHSSSSSPVLTCVTHINYTPPDTNKLSGKSPAARLTITSLTWNSGMVERMSMQMEANRNSEDTITRTLEEVTFI